MALSCFTLSREGSLEGRSQRGPRNLSGPASLHLTSNLQPLPFLQLPHNTCTTETHLTPFLSSSCVHVSSPRSGAASSPGPTFKPATFKSPFKSFRIPI